MSIKKQVSFLLNLSILLGPMHHTPQTQGPDPLRIEIRTKDLNIQRRIAKRFHYHTQQQ